MQAPDSTDGGIDLASPKEDLRTLLAESVRSAELGNPVAAAVAASLIHLKHDKGNDFTANYDHFLTRVLESQDAELMVCVGEEVLAGDLFAENVEQAYRFFRRADDLSGFMGAYVAAKILRDVNPKKSRELLQHAIKAGHIPSLMLMHALSFRRVPLFGPLLRLVFFFADGIRITRAFDDPNLALRFWRYRDMSTAPIPPVDESIGQDRRRPLDGLKLALNAAK
jgi:hypothetical protein